MVKKKKKKFNFIRHRRSGSANCQDGVALIIALICLFIASTLAVGVMFSTQSEIWTSANYRATSQARYIAEAGAQQALNYLGSLQYTTADLTSTNFSLNTMPVMYIGSTPSKPVILATSGMASINSAYTDTYSSINSTQDSTFTTYFNNVQSTISSAAQAASPTIPNAQVNVAMQLLSALQNADGSWLLRWKIISVGTLSTIGSGNSGKAQVQVVEVVDNVNKYNSSSSTSTSPTYAAAVFATGTGCGAISMSGGQYTNSYNDATQLGNTSPTLANTGGDVATYGNVKVTNGAYVIGNVFTPYYNVGATGTYGIAGGPTWPGLNSTTSSPYSATCSTAKGGTEWAVYEDNSGSSVGCTAANSSSCSQKTYSLPTPAPSYPTPVMPTVATNTAACTGYNGLCAGGSGGGSGCSISIPPSTNPNGSAGSGAANFGKVNFGSCSVITLSAGTYNMDSLLISNGAKIVLSPSTATVVINILDQGSTTSCNGSNTPLCINGGTVANDGQSPADLTFVYAGTKPVYVDAGTNIFASVYAPNAPITIDGNAGIYGAVVSNTATFQGSGHVIYDTNLTNQHWNVNTGSGPPTPTAGPIHIDEFSWSAF